MLNILVDFNNIKELLFKIKLTNFPIGLNSKFYDTKEFFDY